MSNFTEDQIQRYSDELNKYTEENEMSKKNLFDRYRLQLQQGESSKKAMTLPSASCKFWASVDEVDYIKFDSEPLLTFEIPESDFEQMKKDLELAEMAHEYMRASPEFAQLFSQMATFSALKKIY